jgi:predicted ATPase
MDATQQTASTVARWRQQEGLLHVRLGNLTEPGSVAMVAEMLHVDPATAADLVEAIEPHMSGNPYETVELLNALRRDGVLTATPSGWNWDAAAVRSHLGRSEVAGLLAARVQAMRAPSRYLVEAMACLGGRVELSLLQAATATPASTVEHRLGPALDDGLLLVEPAPSEAVQFRHDRIREAVLRGLDPPRRRALQLAMARRLAEVPQLYAAAA